MRSESEARDELERHASARKGKPGRTWLEPSSGSTARAPSSRGVRLGELVVVTVAGVAIFASLFVIALN